MNKMKLNWSCKWRCDASLFELCDKNPFERLSYLNQQAFFVPYCQIVSDWSSLLEITVGINNNLNNNSRQKF